MKIQTEAKKVRDEFSKNLPYLYSGSLQNHKLESVTYEVIYEDIDTYWKQPSYLREGFSCTDDTVTIPTFFTKVNGVFKEKKQYVSFVKSLLDCKNTIHIDDSWQMNTKLNTKNKLVNVYLSEKDIPSKYEDKSCYELTLENVMQGRVYNLLVNIDELPFLNLITSKQKALLSALDLTLKEYDKVLTPKEKCTLIACVFLLNDDIICMLNNFDYAADVPKLVISNQNITKIPVFLFMILNRVGIDILFLSPTGKTTVERYVDIDCYGLGYFVKEFDLGLELTNPIKKYKEKLNISISKWVDSGITERILYFFYSIPYAYIAIMAIVYGILIFKQASLLILVLVSIWHIIVSIFLLHVYDENNDLTESLGNCLYGMIGVMIALPLILFLGSNDLSTYEPTVKSGYVSHESNMTENKEKEFQCVVAKNGVYDANDENLYLYIENNANNTMDVYVKVFIGNTEVYKSSTLNPLNYITKFYLSQSLPIGDVPMTVKFYDANGSKEQVLGEVSTVIHCVEGDIESALKQYGYN